MMNTYDESLEQYILEHIDDEGDYLHALYRDTHVKLLRPRMASGHLQGRMLKMFVEMIRPKQILEIGTYSGYSAICLAEGLKEGGMLHTFEINDEQEDFTRPWLENSPVADKIKFYIGDALQLLPSMDIPSVDLYDGQLMGHPLSFPLLCVIKLSVYRTAIDRWVNSAPNNFERRCRKIVEDRCGKM